MDDNYHLHRSIENSYSGSSLDVKVHERYYLIQAEESNDLDQWQQMKRCVMITEQIKRYGGNQVNPKVKLQIP